MLKKIEHMMQLQDEVNTIVHPEWKTQDFNWRRAAVVECAELMEHIGWKWWKKQTPNIEQAKLELVDIWHFMLSSCIAGEVSSTKIHSSLAMVDHANYSFSPDVAYVENIMRHLLCSGKMSMWPMDSFFLCCKSLDLSFNELYKLYVGKLVLNKFRLANGYKEGTYIKTWFNREDNDYLYELLGLLDSAHEDFMESIEKSLTNAYQTVVEDSSDL